MGDEMVTTITGCNVAKNTLLEINVSINFQKKPMELLQMRK